AMGGNLDLPSGSGSIGPGFERETHGRFVSIGQLEFYPPLSCEIGQRHINLGRLRVTGKFPHKAVWAQYPQIIPAANLPGIRQRTACLDRVAARNALQMGAVIDVKYR